MTSTLRAGRTYWLDRNRGRTPRFPAFRGGHVSDVAIVGGGFTGCLTAYLLADAGLSVTLLEADRIGRGSTAASTALLLRDPDSDFRALAARYGTARTRTIWNDSAASLRGLIDVLRRLRISAALRTLPSIRMTDDPSSARNLQRELARRRRFGVSGRWVGPAGLKHLTGIEGCGGILNAAEAELDPYRACVGLIERARRRGVRAHEHSRVLRVTGGRDDVRIEVDRGELRAAWAVIATGYATPDFKPLAARFRMSNTYVIGTPRIDSRTRQQMGLGDVMLWDTKRPYHYARWTPDRRVLCGGEDEPIDSHAARGGGIERHAARLMNTLVKWYPGLEGMTPDFAWSGVFATTPDGLPYIGRHRRYPRQLFALGYGGNGMTFAHLAANIILRTVQGRATDDDRFFGFARINGSRSRKTSRTD